MNEIQKQEVKGRIRLIRASSFHARKTLPHAKHTPNNLKPIKVIECCWLLFTANKARRKYCDWQNLSFIRTALLKFETIYDPFFIKNSMIWIHSIAIFKCEIIKYVLCI
jgi:hypothetical protein